MKALGWVVISIILIVITYICWACLLMASKWDDIAEEYWNEYGDEEDSL
jgi:uncharacterized membrane protein